MSMSMSSVPSLAYVGVSHGDRNGPRTPSRCTEWVMKKFQMTHFDMPNNVSSMKYALKSIPGLADVGVPHGDRDCPRPPQRFLEGVWKKFQMTHFDMPNNVSSMKYALISPA